MPTSEALHVFCAELTNHLDDQPSSERHLRVVWIAKTLRECVQHQRELLAHPLIRIGPPGLMCGFHERCQFWRNLRDFTGRRNETLIEIVEALASPDNVGENRQP